MSTSLLCLKHHYRAVLVWGPQAPQQYGVWIMRASYAKNLQRLPDPADWLKNSWKFVLLCLLQDNSAPKGKTCGVKLGREVPKNHFLTAVVKTAA